MGSEAYDQPVNRWGFLPCDLFGALLKKRTRCGTKMAAMGLTWARIILIDAYGYLPFWYGIIIDIKLTTANVRIEF